jgi:hypothetical protein
MKILSSYGWILREKHGQMVKYPWLKCSTGIRGECFMKELETSARALVRGVHIRASTIHREFLEMDCLGDSLHIADV